MSHVSQRTVNRLLESLRCSGFSYGIVRVDGVHLEFGQAPVSASAPAPQAVPETAPVTETAVRAGGPGTVELAVSPGDTVEEGTELGHVRVHRKTVPLVAPVRGRVASVLLPTGAFAAYADTVCFIESD